MRFRKPGPCIAVLAAIVSAALLPALVVPSHARDASACDTATLPAFERVAPGHVVRVGHHAEMRADNCGAIANSGFVIGERSVALIDPGGSPADGRALLADVARHTALPISHVVITHAHPDHYFGLAAFAGTTGTAALPVLVVHERLQRALAQRDGVYTERFEVLLDTGESVLATPFPWQVARAGDVIDLGGRQLQLLPMPVAHTESDLAVLDAAAGVLWAGDLLFETRLPSLDGSLDGWLAVMDTLEQDAPALVVPGHGQPGPWPRVAAPQRQYLETLQSRTRAALAQRIGLADYVRWPHDADAAATLPGAERRDWQPHWQLFDTQHPVNLGRAYTELEWE